MLEALAFLCLGLWVAWLVVPNQVIWVKRSLLLLMSVVTIGLFWYGLKLFFS